ncbi:methyltransferase domain-containing protein [Helicobacter sp. MIT 21-1697]|uniref:class I SAM-dependent methyltransferase n=1 Tax=Helicobacter sp. MIT 21-1697 TaxID=2993733 RepID=UPI00224A98BC|nr:methyltransferase domain-containing protein [Helicobacter sp. MIT 21-1697]MCX2716546.1 methyltransferase domain-containing protein [Helicobacter sp. MIT 21-1697]
MQEDALKWNARYQENFMPNEPSPFILQACEEIERNFSFAHSQPLKALDIACGNGRHSKILAQMGFEVDALDISSVALKNLTNIPHITPILADLDTFKLPQAHYDVILDSFFLDRNLFDSIINALKPNAMLIFETFIDTTSHQPLNDKALYAGELEAIFTPQRGFEILHQSIYKSNKQDSHKTNPAYQHIMRFIAKYTPCCQCAPKL